MSKIKLLYNILIMALTSPAPLSALLHQGGVTTSGTSGDILFARDYSQHLQILQLWDYSWIFISIVLIFSIFVVIVFVLSYNFTRQNHFMNGTFLLKTLCPLYVAESGQRTEASWLVKILWDFKKLFWFRLRQKLLRLNRKLCNKLHLLSRQKRKFNAIQHK